MEASQSKKVLPGTQSFHVWSKGEKGLELRTVSLQIGGGKVYVRVLLFCGDMSVRVFQNTCLLQYARSLPTCHLCAFNGMCDLACLRLHKGYLGVVRVFFQRWSSQLARGLHM